MCQTLIQFRSLWHWENENLQLNVDGTTATFSLPVSYPQMSSTPKSSTSSLQNFKIPGLIRCCRILTLLGFVFNTKIIIMYCLQVVGQERFLIQRTQHTALVRGPAQTHRVYWPGYLTATWSDFASSDVTCSSDKCIVSAWIFFHTRWDPKRYLFYFGDETTGVLYIHGDLFQHTPRKSDIQVLTLRYLPR